MKLRTLAPIRPIIPLRGIRTLEKGFTLIEIMIVLVIIGILATIAYPSYRHSIQTTNRKAAIVEMQIIGQALERYYNHHNGTYDDGVDPTNTNATIDSLVTTINARIKGYTISVTIDDTTDNLGQAYTIVATKSDMGDPECGNLTIDSYDTKTSSKGSNCFR